MALKQGRQKPYGHGLTKMGDILLEINHIVFKKQLTLSFQMNGYTKYQVVLTSLQKWIILPTNYLISACNVTLQNGLIYRQFSYNIILRGYDTISAIFNVFLHFQSLRFSKILTHQLKPTVETLSLILIETFSLTGSIEC